jgi:calcineurin-like phosphoesterase family protein
MAFTRKFFIADTHFGHAGIINSCNRPFESIDEMDAAMIENWNATVSDADVIFHLGDFAKGADPDRVTKIFSRLRGRKRLILGNHDLDSKGRPLKHLAALAWDQPPTHFAETREGDERIILSHYGMRTWSASVHGSWHFYGHSHGRLPELGRSRDVGVDVADVAFTPRTFAQLTAGMKAAEVVA